jgi:hypothetical protein
MEEAARGMISKLSYEEKLALYEMLKQMQRKENEHGSGS